MALRLTLRTVRYRSRKNFARVKGGLQQGFCDAVNACSHTLQSQNKLGRTKFRDR